MAKAHDLLEKHNIQLVKQSETRDFQSVFVGKPALRHSREHYHLSRLLVDFYFVFGIWVPVYVLQKGRMGRVLELSGTLENVKIASYVHGFVLNFIEFQWMKYNKDRRLNRYRKTDFSVGIIEGFRSKLETQNQRRKRDTKSVALVEVQDPVLEQYVAYRYPRINKVRGRTSRRDEDVLKDGKSIGEKLVIHKGIEEKGGRGRPLIRDV
jgi:hypothetical protein